LRFVSGSAGKLPKPLTGIHSDDVQPKLLSHRRLHLRNSSFRSTPLLTKRVNRSPIARATSTAATLESRLHQPADSMPPNLRLNSLNSRLDKVFRRPICFALQISRQKFLSSPFLRRMRASG
jgi:hypothetical protein